MELPDLSGTCRVVANGLDRALHLADDAGVAPCQHVARAINERAVSRRDDARARCLLEFVLVLPAQDAVIDPEVEDEVGVRDFFGTETHVANDIEARARRALWVAGD